MKAYPNPDVNTVGRIFPPFKLIDPEYVIGTENREGYSVVQSFPYLSILGGLKNKEMLVLKRN
jgi:hypothetical protein